MKKIKLFIIYSFWLTIGIGQTKKYPLILTQYDVEEVFEQSKEPYSYYRLRDTKEIYTGWYFTLGFSYKEFSIKYIQSNGVYRGEVFYDYVQSKKDGKFYLESVKLDDKYVILFDKKHKIKKALIPENSKITTVLYKKDGKYVVKENLYDSDGNVTKKKKKVTTYKGLDKILDNLVFPYVLDDYFDLFNNMERRCN